MPCVSEPQAFYKRVTLEWPWNKNTQTKQNKGQKQKEIQMNVAFQLVMQTLGRKNFMPNNFLEINQKFALMW